MQNIHDMAKELSDAIRASEEYRAYIAIKEKAGQNPELTEALNDFRGKQFEMQKRQMMGENPGPDVLAQMQNLGQILMRDPLAAEFLQAEMRFTLIVNDVYQILAEAVKTD
ncbi:MAG: YlbF family regulator [Clostridiales Family XIII bacterium]|jgi:cell fate (sporulation/competence/biofilm development) regulator YlbF (YheA/YmcA/DUF963 family)|nr:YlbF family regulator [Clostridiales Family XIII bacterium]